jgi:methionyl-tRNA formyltransferase
MKIIFMGSADFGIPALTALLQSHTVIGVVSTPAKPQGRGLKVTDSPISLFAKQNGIHSILTPETLNSEELIKELTSMNADLFVVVAYRILPKSIFTIPRYGTVNIHASLLPKFRGPAPIHRAIEAGEKETGVTIFRIDEGIDTGEIISQKKIPIYPEETTPELYHKLSLAGAEMLVEAIGKIENGSTAFHCQEHLKSSKAPKLSKDEGHIDWNDTADRIFNKIRAFKPFPGTYCFLDQKRLGIDWAVAINSTVTGCNGMIVEVTDKYFDVCCNGGKLRVLRVKPEGRKVMDVHDFLLGKRLIEGCTLK